MAVVEQRLGDDPDRVREVDDPRALRGPLGGPLGEVEHDRHGPERLGEPAGAGRLLADRAEPGRQRLVDEPRRLAADAQLDQHEVGAVDGGIGVAGAHEPPRPLEPVEHPRRQPADDLEALRIDVEEDELVDREAVGAPRDALDQLRRVGAAPAHDRELHAQLPDLRFPPLTSRAIAYNVINSRAAHKWQRRRQVEEETQRPVARYRLELGPVPLHHQVYLDLRAALDVGEWQGRRSAPARTRARAPLRLLPDHGSAGPRRALAREPPPAHARARDVRAPAAPRRRRRSTARVFTEEMQRRGLDAETRLLAARPEAASESVAAALDLAARLPHPVRGAAAPRRRRAAAARDGPPARRALPGPARLGPRAQLPVRAAHERYGTSVERAREALEPVLLPPARHGCSGCRRAASRCSSRASPTRAMARRSSSGGPTSAATAPGTTSSASSSGPAPAAQSGTHQGQPGRRLSREGRSSCSRSHRACFRSWRRSCWSPPPAAPRRRTRACRLPPPAARPRPPAGHPRRPAPTVCPPDLPAFPPSTRPPCAGTAASGTGEDPTQKPTEDEVAAGFADEAPGQQPEVRGHDLRPGGRRPLDPDRRAELAGHRRPGRRRRHRLVQGPVDATSRRT